MEYYDEGSVLEPDAVIMPGPPAVREPDIARFAEDLVASAGPGSIALTGEGGLLGSVVKQILQAALEAGGCCTNW